jgi:hypothetical protein
VSEVRSIGFDNDVGGGGCVFGLDCDLGGILTKQTSGASIGMLASGRRFYAIERVMERSLPTLVPSTVRFLTATAGRYNQ